MMEIDCYYCNNYSEDYCTKHRLFIYQINVFNSNITKKDCFEGDNYNLEEKVD